MKKCIYIFQWTQQSQYNNRACIYYTMYTKHDALGRKWYELSKFKLILMVNSSPTRTSPSNYSEWRHLLSINWHYPLGSPVMLNHRRCSSDRNIMIAVSSLPQSRVSDPKVPGGSSITATSLAGVTNIRARGWNEGLVICV